MPPAERRRRRAPLPLRGGRHTGDSSLANEYAAFRAFNAANTTPMDILHDTSDVFEGIASDVASIPSGLMGLLDVLNSGQTPQVIGEAAVEGMVDQYSDPAGYIREHPGLFMMDVIPALGIADNALGAVARRVDFADETGAIGAGGQLLESGRPFALDVKPEFVSPRWSATFPRQATATFENPHASPIARGGLDETLIQAAQGHPREWLKVLNERLGIPEDEFPAFGHGMPQNYWDEGYETERVLNDRVRLERLGGYNADAVTERTYGWFDDAGIPQATLVYDKTDPGGFLLNASPGAPPNAVPELLDAILRDRPEIAIPWMNNPGVASHLSKKGALTFQNAIRNWTRPGEVVPALVKPGRVMLPNHYTGPGQAEGELATAFLNREMGNYARIPGVAPEQVTLPFAQIKKKMIGAPDEFYPPQPRALTVMENIEDATDVRDIDDYRKMIESEVAREDLRDITLMDLITGNADRGIYSDQYTGKMDVHNLMQQGGRPIGIDNGMGFDQFSMGTENLVGTSQWEDMDYIPDYWAPRHVLEDPTFRPREFDALNQAGSLLEQASVSNSLPAISRSVTPMSLEQAIKRIQYLINLGRFPGGPV